MDRVQRQRTLCRIHAQYHYKRKARFAPMQVRLENVTKKFPGVTAVNTFSVTLPASWGDHYLTECGRTAS